MAINIGKLQKEIYLESGYVNMKAIIETGVPFIMITGGRGTGKTYGALQYLAESGKKFMFLRRTMEQMKTISSHEYNVFNPYNRRNDRKIYPYTIGKNTIAYCDSEWNDERHEYQRTGGAIGYLSALTSISKMRGFDAEAIEVCVLDEFCPELHERPIKDEENAVPNAYETINRNRDIDGGKPLQFIMLANANDIRSKILSAFGAAEIMAKMHQRGKMIWLSRDEQLMIIRLKDSPISAMKENTALYKVMKNSRYAEMAIANNFAEEDDSNIRSQNLNEYRPIVRVGDITIYKHKAQALYYVSKHYSGNVEIYGTEKYNLNRFKTRYFHLKQSFINNRILYENVTCYVLFTQYLFER